MKKAIVLIGKESVGKSQLIRSLTGKAAQSERVRGTTTSVQTYETDAYKFVDTPGIFLKADTMTSRMAMEQISENRCIGLIVSAAGIDRDLEDLLPLVEDRPGFIVITHWDKMNGGIDEGLVDDIEREVGVPVFKVDARAIDSEDKEAIFESIDTPKTFRAQKLRTRINVELKPAADIFDIPVLGKILAIIMLFVPAWVAVQFAVYLADTFYDSIFNPLSILLAQINTLPAPISHLLGMDYGIIAMFPFLVLYALPTVFLFAVVWSLYKTSGLIDRLTVTIHNLVSPFGLVGRDVVRVIMGFGCNVPAVISTRSCSDCTRGNCISAIAFGAACSYQLPATLAVFAAARMPHLVLPYLIILVTTTMIYLYVSTPAETKRQTSQMVASNQEFIQWPTLSSIFYEMAGLVREFFKVAFPIFILICLIAGVLDWLGVISLLSIGLEPVMALFNLPPEAATSVILGSIRKDGIAIGLLNPAWDGLKVPITSQVQVLTVVYLAGVLLPCLVTLFTIMREISVRFALKLVARQMAAAVLFSLVLAWTGFLFL